MSSRTWSTHPTPTRSSATTSSAASRRSSWPSDTPSARGRRCCSRTRCASGPVATCADRPRGSLQAGGSDGGAEGGGDCLDATPCLARRRPSASTRLPVGGDVLGGGLRGRGLLLLGTLAGTSELEEARRTSVRLLAELRLLATYAAQLGEQPPLDRHHGGQADDDRDEHQHQERGRAEHSRSRAPRRADEDRRDEGDPGQPHQAIAATPRLLGRSLGPLVSGPGPSCSFRRPGRGGPAVPRAAPQRQRGRPSPGTPWRGRPDLPARRTAGPAGGPTRPRRRRSRVAAQGPLDRVQLVQLGGKADDHSGSLAAGAVW